MYILINFIFIFIMIPIIIIIKFTKKFKKNNLPIIIIIFLIHLIYFITDY